MKKEIRSRERREKEEEEEEDPKRRVIYPMRNPKNEERSDLPQRQVGVVRGMSRWRETEEG